MTATILPHPDVVARPLDDDVVLVNLHTNRIFTLNRTGSRIWELLAAGRSREEIELALETEFEVERVEAGRELSALLDRLLSEGLVVRGE